MIIKIPNISVLYRRKIPVWAVNKATKHIAPRVISCLVKAARTYPAWKARHSPHLKPWRNPDQLTVPRINWADVSPVPSDLFSSSNGEATEEDEGEEDVMAADEEALARLERDVDQLIVDSGIYTEDIVDSVEPIMLETGFNGLAKPVT
ncbi:unnamed protein product [Protopolystoma xenopodis]|uniref:START domain-containing protein n=1 Tax=Protopolystoma xenopodis TaxID=117903 RepID=A0A448WAP9_9PLAT|nr:unnamed protein product [Protopolystoma xenopodis]